ncbi:stress responsive A/B barrel domain protein [Exophiala viscosa]|uniref:Stress responsive A/B barrel domain protein n=1 Tax=Exophiala viscosa TaxID=2486360 RepID=A0AAN6E5V4_9EURO|nr:stress responsive A/B barrel domain protein [Exophiala viscosa]KAI1629305.1 stress responsive A/B barrel domain protein [Exophiala viscosa]
MGSVAPASPERITTSPILHVVHFRFYPSITPEVRASISQAFLDLRYTCISPTTKKPYIKSFTGGRDVSIENLQHGFSHVFMLEFETQEDRDWYVNEDPIHRRFGVEQLTGVVEDVMVVDFRRGEL